MARKVADMRSIKAQRDVRGQTSSFTFSDDFDLPANDSEGENDDSSDGEARDDEIDSKAENLLGNLDRKRENGHPNSAFLPFVIT